MNRANQRTTSLGKFRYTLRPAKNIERKMLCEAFGSLASLAPLRSYRYIGLGGVEFADFALLHQRLGITRMLSIECRDDATARIKFNVPYLCIKMKWGISHEVLPTLNWRKKTIIWLDYDSPLETKMLDDIRLVTSSLVSGSMIVITVEAKPKEIEGNVNIAHERLQTLVQNVGEDRLPLMKEGDRAVRSLKGSDLAEWGLARVSRQIIDAEIARTLKDRNAPLDAESRVSYEQLFNFHYADGAKMLTVGGIIRHARDASRIPESTFDMLEFVRRAEDPYLIEAPVLTSRELTYLDRHLTRGFRGAGWLPQTECEKYKKVYRYHPTFAEVERG
jgi:hypothetical protein